MSTTTVIDYNVIIVHSLYYCVSGCHGRLTIYWVMMLVYAAAGRTAVFYKQSPHI